MDKDSAKIALKRLQGHSIDGHCITLKISNRGAGADEASAGNGRTASGLAGKKGKGLVTSKLLVKNVPFQATKRDVRDLFSTFGALKSVRMPTKVGGGCSR